MPCVPLHRYAAMFFYTSWLTLTCALTLLLGTMNFYSISAGLESAQALPAVSPSPTLSLFLPRVGPTLIIACIVLTFRGLTLQHGIQRVRSRVEVRSRGFDPGLRLEPELLPELVSRWEPETGCYPALSENIY